MGRCAVFKTVIGNGRLQIHGGGDLEAANCFYDLIHPVQQKLLKEVFLYK